jgi:hypothetical protein
VKDTVTVTMPAEEAAQRWLRQQGMCAVPWTVLNHFLAAYHKHGDKEAVFDQKRQTYSLRKKKRERRHK